MSFTHGMDPGEVEALGRALQDRAQTFEQLVAEVNRLVLEVVWNGPDATAFKQQWWPEHRTLLETVVEELRGLGQSALNNANEQRRVSESDYASLGSGSSRPGSSQTWALPGSSTVNYIGQIDEGLLGPLGALFSSLGSLKDPLTGSMMLHHGGLFNTIGDGFSAFSTAISGTQAGYAFTEGRYLDAALHGGDIGMSALKKKFYLGGLVGQTYIEVARAAQAIDWNDDPLGALVGASWSDWRAIMPDLFGKDLPGPLIRIFSF